MVRLKLIAAMGLAVLMVGNIAKATEFRPVIFKDLSITPEARSRGMVIDGVAINLTEKTLRNVVLNFDLYDEDDRKIGNTTTSVASLPHFSHIRFHTTTRITFDHYKLHPIL